MGQTRYQEALSLVSTLTPDEKLRLIETILPTLRNATAEEKTHTIQEFRGVGKELWCSVDVDEYLRKEREAWNG